MNHYLFSKIIHFDLLFKLIFLEKKFANASKKISYKKSNNKNNKKKRVKSEKEKMKIEKERNKEKKILIKQC